MKKAYLLVFILLICTLPGALTADETTPAVTISNNPIAIPGEEYSIDVTISGAYIENSTLEIDFEAAPGWGATEQGYFDFSVESHWIEKMEPDELLTFTFVMEVDIDAAEKEYTIPIVFYGKSGECDTGCIPFRSTLSATLEVMDPQNAKQREEMADEAFDEEKYSLAKLYYQEAKTLYTALGNATKTTEMDQNIERAGTGIQAIQLYDSGKSKMNAGNREGALEDFISSKERFQEIGNISKISELDGLIESCQSNGDEPPANGDDGGSSNALLPILALLVIIAAIVAAIVIKYK